MLRFGLLHCSCPQVTRKGLDIIPSQIDHELTEMRRATSQCLNARLLSRRAGCTVHSIRAITSSAGRMTSNVKTVEPPLPSTDPTASFQLLSTSDKAGTPEDAIFDEQVAQVNDWWASPRYKGIKRPYSAEAVVSKRGTLQQSYPSSLMARKLFNLLEAKAAKGEPVHTSASLIRPRMILRGV